MKGYFIDITNNLLEPKHQIAMKESVWLFMWLLDKMTSISEDGIGKVLGGKPITWEKDIWPEMKLPERTYTRWLSNLKKHGYINVLRTPYGCVLTVNKARKRFGRYAKNDERYAKNCKRYATSGSSNIRQYKDNTIDNTIIIKNKKDDGTTDHAGLRKYNTLKADLSSKLSFTPALRTAAQEEVAVQIRSGIKK